MVRVASWATRTETSERRRLLSIDLLQVVPHEVGLNRNEVLHRAATCQRIQAVDVLLEPLLGQAEPFARDLLRALRQHGGGLRHCLKVLRRPPGQLLRLRLGEAESPRELFRDLLEGLGGRVQTDTHGFLHRLGALTSSIGAGANCMFARVGRLLSIPSRCTGGLISRIQASFAALLVDSLGW
jgi:hypothetical protein